MTPYDIARLHLGLKEVPGDADNPDILAMYARVGHGWVEHDEVAWCAAFVGSCLEPAGERSTRSLTARSYLDWGVPVELADAQTGDIVIFKRGSSSWQGHVGFFVESRGASIAVLGGNQKDSVSVATYAREDLLGIRRAGDVAPSVTMPLARVQSLLSALGYHEVGRADGIMGPRTKGALLAFRAEQGLPLKPIVDAELVAALFSATPRSVTESRAQGTPASSRILAASEAQIGLGSLGLMGTLGGKIAGALSEAEDAQGMAVHALSILGLEAARVEALLPWIGAAVFAGVILYALKARSARIEDHRTGRTP